MSKLNKTNQLVTINNYQYNRFVLYNSYITVLDRTDLFCTHIGETFCDKNEDSEILVILNTYSWTTFYTKAVIYKQWPHTHKHTHKESIVIPNWPVLN